MSTLTISSSLGIDSDDESNSLDDNHSHSNVALDNHRHQADKAMYDFIRSEISYIDTDSNETDANKRALQVHRCKAITEHQIFLESHKEFCEIPVEEEGYNFSPENREKKLQSIERGLEEQFTIIRANKANTHTVYTNECADDLAQDFALLLEDVLNDARMDGIKSNNLLKKMLDHALYNTFEVQLYLAELPDSFKEHLIELDRPPILDLKPDSDSHQIAKLTSMMAHFYRLSSQTS